MRNIQDLTKLVFLYEKLTWSKYWAFLLLAQDVFTYLNHRSYANMDLSAYVSFFEIYNGKVRKNKISYFHGLIYWKLQIRHQVVQVILKVKYIFLI